MLIQLTGIGFRKKINVKEGSKLADLKAKLRSSDKSEERGLNTFYKKGKTLDDNYTFKEGDELTAVTKAQQPRLG